MLKKEELAPTAEKIREEQTKEQGEIPERVIQKIVEKEVREIARQFVTATPSGFKPAPVGPFYVAKRDAPIRSREGDDRDRGYTFRYTRVQKLHNVQKLSKIFANNI